MCVYFCIIVEFSSFILNTTSIIKYVKNKVAICLQWSRLWYIQCIWKLHLNVSAMFFETADRLQDRRRHLQGTIYRRSCLPRITCWNNYTLTRTLRSADHFLLLISTFPTSAVHPTSISVLSAIFALFLTQKLPRPLPVLLLVPD